MRGDNIDTPGRGSTAPVEDRYRADADLLKNRSQTSYPRPRHRTQQRDRPTERPLRDPRPSTEGQAFGRVACAPR